MHFHPGPRPKGKQVYLDSGRGQSAGPMGQAWACRGGGVGRGLHQQWGSRVAPGPADTLLCDEGENTGDREGRPLGQGRGLSPVLGPH